MDVVYRQMRRRLYIYSIAALCILAASCGKRDPNILSETGKKTPLRVQTNLTIGSPATKAYDNYFEAKDRFVTYIQAGTRSEGVFTDEYQFSKAVAFSLKEGTILNTPVSSDPGEKTQYTTDFKETIYWDDFSSTAYDLRATDKDRGIRLFYGICYNGGTPSSALIPGEGTFGWTVKTDQSSGIKTSDLLVAPTQDMIKYHHDPASRGKLVIPFRHAMSKLTVEIICADGFSDENENFASTSVSFKGMNTACSIDAPAAAVSGFGTGSDVKAFKIADSESPNVKCSFTSLIVPTLFKEGTPLAHIDNIAGNSYDIVLTDEILTTAKTGLSNPWSSKLAAHDAISLTPLSAGAYNSTDGGYTIPGVNYLLTVTVKKQEITVMATITNWDEVSMEGVGKIEFANDVTTTGTIAEALAENGFDIYQKGWIYNDFTKTTHVGYDQEQSKWTYSPAIYWPDGETKFEFRALSGSEDFNMLAGKDVLWGTSGNDPIPPRTGDVGLTFSHVMSKITVILKDGRGVEYDPTYYSYLFLDGAKIQITGVKKHGTLDISTGLVTATGAAQNLFDGDGLNAANDESVGDSPKVEHYVVVPQVFNDDMKVRITLMASGHGAGHGAGHGGSAYGTTYSINLRTLSNQNWEPGKHYTYTITLKKESISFGAMIENWVEEEGGGNANIEWD